MLTTRKVKWREDCGVGGVCGGGASRWSGGEIAALWLRCGRGVVSFAFGAWN